MFRWLRPKDIGWQLPNWYGLLPLQPIWDGGCLCEAFGRKHLSLLCVGRTGIAIEHGTAFFSLTMFFFRPVSFLLNLNHSFVEQNDKTVASWPVFSKLRLIEPLSLSVHRDAQGDSSVDHVIESRSEHIPRRFILHGRLKVARKWEMKLQISIKWLFKLFRYVNLDLQNFK